MSAHYVPEIVLKYSICIVSTPRGKYCCFRILILTLQVQKLWLRFTCVLYSLQGVPRAPLRTADLVQTPCLMKPIHSDFISSSHWPPYFAMWWPQTHRPQIVRSFSHSKSIVLYSLVMRGYSDETNTSSTLSRLSIWWSRWEKSIEIRWKIGSRHWIHWAARCQPRVQADIGPSGPYLKLPQLNPRPFIWLTPWNCALLWTLWPTSLHQHPGHEHHE